MRLSDVSDINMTEPEVLQEVIGVSHGRRRYYLVEIGVGEVQFVRGGTIMEDRLPMVYRMDDPKTRSRIDLRHKPVIRSRLSQDLESSKGRILP